MVKDSHVSIDVLRSTINSLPQETQSEVLSTLTKLGIDLSKNNSDLTGTGVAAFFLENHIYEATSHKDVFLKVAEFVLKKYPNEENKIFEIKGSKKKYFSKNPGDFSHGYEKIPGTIIYADTNENAAQLNRRCQRILQTLGGLLFINC
jgi:hypothetical protein